MITGLQIIGTIVVVCVVAAGIAWFEDNVISKISKRKKK